VSAQVVGGWITGTLPGPEGREYKVEHVRRTSPAPKALVKKPPNLVLHTTETDGLGDMPANHDFPPNAWVGDHRIVQTYSVFQGGHSTDEQDSHAFQIEVVGRSQVPVWLPQASSLFPLVALVAFLHERDLITTGLDRPEGQKWAINVDRLPAATDAYFRRKAGLWPHRAGVYGHIDMPGDEHWDPGGFDYPRFFDMVRSVLEGKEWSDVFKNKTEFREETRGALVGFTGTGDDRQPALPAVQVKEALEFELGQRARWKGQRRPPSSDAARRDGWDYADALLTAVKDRSGDSDG
jgi:hypothetical protein